MVGGVSDDGPLIQPVDTVSPTTVIALSVGSVLLVVGCWLIWFLCRRRRESAKLTQAQYLAFKPPHKKPTAVKSPGSTSHYLKKSPSPTGPAKSPPGTGGQTSPTTGSQSSGPGSQPRTPIGAAETPADAPALTIENERDKAEIEANEKTGTNVDGTTTSTTATTTTTTTRDKEQPENNKYGLGQLVFKLRYRAEQNALAVTVVKCKGLPARGQKNAMSDLYVKLQLLPDKQHQVKTRVVRNTRDPVYNEDFTFFKISRNQLQDINLHFGVWSFDRYSRDDIIGEVVCALSSVPNLESADNQEISLCRKICPRSLKIQSKGRGELLVSVCWQPTAGKLTVVVLKARNLPKMDVTGLADPCVKISLLYKGQRSDRKMTHVRMRTLNPVFNESFVFEIPNSVDGLRHVSLEFMLFDWDPAAKNQVIGRLVLGGPKCQESALNHWNEAFSSPKRQIAYWHKLTE